MPETINVGSISGYETMTAEEKVKALESFDISSISNAKAEAVQTKSNNELKALQEQVDELQLKLKISDLGAALAPYVGKNSTAFATSIYKGDPAEIVAMVKEATESAKGQAAADLIKSTPIPQAGNSDVQADYTKQIEEAISNGDILAATHLTRLAQERGSK